MSVDPERPAPIWPPDLWISPTKLKAYTNCPHRVRLQYLDKIPAPQPFNVFLTKGTIAHDALRMNAQRIRGGLEPIGEAEIRTRTVNRLPRREFPSDAALQAEVNQVVRWVAFGTRQIDRQGEIINIESNSHRQVPVPAVSGRLTWSTRPDLIQVRADENGERFVDIVDYKTGSMTYVDEIPPVVMRFVFKELFREKVSPDTLAIPMIFRYVYLDHADETIIELTPEYIEAQWSKVSDLVARLVTEREWPVQPSKLCNYCPFNGNACHAFAAWIAESEDSS